MINKNSEAIKHQASQIEIHSEHINSFTQKSTNDFNDMKSKLQVLENDQDLSNEFDNGSQFL